ncbi:uncharacterized protein DFL_005375 [Arthrobotrys flagrans]|uniref:Uncharacterized protein n=1 Tax=Arthrobotrys flagrans TaxID=97331 RepID=A0A437A7N3_ARTFL|nr:hypothetical protein DFL_005375 [Arthrobotrys flagrans]
MASGFDKRLEGKITAILAFNGNIREVDSEGSGAATGPISTAFFFLRESDTQLLDVNEMLKALAYQITESGPLFKRHAIEVCKSSRNAMTAEDTRKNLFQKYYL